MKKYAIPDNKKQILSGNQQNAQIMTTNSTKRVAFLFALTVSGRERSDKPIAFN